MNIYFTKIQKRMEVEKIDWNDIIGMSNFELNVNSIYQYNKGYLETDKIPVEKIRKRLQFFFYRNKNKFEWPKLVPVFVDHVKLENVGNISFPPWTHFQYIQFLEITNCNIKYFPWKNIPIFLRKLNLSNNKLVGHINLSACKQLRFIYLSHNFIESIDLPYDANTVDLSFNKIKYIDFYNPLMFANFSWNCLTEFTGSKWLEKVNLSHNSIRICSFQNSLKINNINCSFNMIENVIDVSKNIHVTKLNLSNNKITGVDGIENLVSLEFCDLSNNLIETFIIPIITKCALNDNPLQYFEFVNCIKSSGFSFTDFVNGENMNNPILNLMSNFLQDKLKMNRVDQSSGVSSSKKKTQNEKYYIDLSNTNIQEFPEDYNYIQGEIHIFFYNNCNIEIPYHPNVHIHLTRKQFYNWKNVRVDENINTNVKLNQLEIQKFYIIDKE